MRMLTAVVAVIAALVWSEPAAAQSALTVTKSGTGTGTVVSTPAGINCGSACAAAFTNGTVVTLQATPGAASSFGGWRVNGQAITCGNPCSGPIAQSVTVTAVFNAVAPPPPPPAPPGKPTAPTLTRVDVHSWTLTWTDVADNETNYVVERAPDAGGVPGTFTTLVTLPANSATYQDRTVVRGLPYWYRVWCFNAVGPSGITPAVPTP